MFDLIAAQSQNPFLYACFHWTLTDKITSSQMSTKFTRHFLSILSCPCSAITAMVCSHCSSRTLPVYFKVQAIQAASLVCFKTSFLLDWTPPCHSCSPVWLANLDLQRNTSHHRSDDEWIWQGFGYSFGQMKETDEKHNMSLFTFCISWPGIAS